MDQPNYDLWYDAATVDADLVVQTWISHSPRFSDVDFDPEPDDWLTVGDGEEPSIRGRVTQRDANKVWVQLELGLASTDAESGVLGHG